MLFDIPTQQEYDKVTDHNVRDVHHDEYRDFKKVLFYDMHSILLHPSCTVVWRITAPLFVLSADTQTPFLQRWPSGS